MYISNCAAAPYEYAPVLIAGDTNFARDPNDQRISALDRQPGVQVPNLDLQIRSTLIPSDLYGTNGAAVVVEVHTS